MQPSTCEVKFCLKNSGDSSEYQVIRMRKTNLSVNLALYFSKSRREVRLDDIVNPYSNCRFKLRCVKKNIRYWNEFANSLRMFRRCPEKFQVPFQAKKGDIDLGGDDAGAGCWEDIRRK